MMLSMLAADMKQNLEGYNYKSTPGSLMAFSQEAIPSSGDIE